MTLANDQLPVSDRQKTAIQESFMLKHVLAATAAATLAVPAMAGGLAAPVEAPEVVVPVVAAPAPSADWTGFYVGLQAGSADADAAPTSTAPDFSLSGTTYGAHIGYLHDFGRFVVGGELRYDDVSDVKSSTHGVGGDSMVAASLRVGYDMGRVLPYLSVGAARFTAADNDESDGIIYGIGADFAMTDNWRLGVEATRFEFDDFDDSTYEVSGNAIGLRVSYAF